jgi:hypothetical protein
LAIATVLQNFDIKKQRDSTGKEIPISGEYGGGFLRSVHLFSLGVNTCSYIVLVTPFLLNVLLRLGQQGQDKLSWRWPNALKPRVSLLFLCLTSVTCYMWCYAIFANHKAVQTIDLSELGRNASMNKIIRFRSLELWLW